MLNLKGFYGRIKGTFSEDNYVQLIINAALGYVSYYCDCGIHAATKNPSSNVFDGGGAEALFERSKPRGFEAFMQLLYRNHGFSMDCRCNRPFHSLK